jgi:hypothetical protein
MGRTRGPQGVAQTRTQEPAGPLWEPEFSLQLHGGSLAGMTFRIGDWPFTDSPPDIVWLAEYGGEVVGHVADKEILNAVAAQERSGLPGWTPYERARAPWDAQEAEPPVGGVYNYTWAQRMDPNAREPRPLRAVS